MKKPSIDRMDKNKDYTFKNCRYIEMTVNRHLGNIKSVLQYDKYNNFINEFKSQREAGKSTGILSGSISKCCRGKVKTAGSFIWKFKK